VDPRAGLGTVFKENYLCLHRSSNHDNHIFLCDTVPAEGLHLYLKLEFADGLIILPTSLGDVASVLRERVSKQVTNGNKTAILDVIFFVCVSLGKRTVQLHDSLGRRRACAWSEAGFSSQNGDRA
jgi:hypothetical protein